MTPEAQKLALLEWAGWKEREYISPLDNKTECVLWESPGIPSQLEPPNLSSLDTIAEFEGKLETMEFQYRARYELWLNEICMRESTAHSVGWLVIRASASIRLEALVRTLGLWKKEE